MSFHCLQLCEKLEINSGCYFSVVKDPLVTKEGQVKSNYSQSDYCNLSLI